MLRRTFIPLSLLVALPFGVAAQTDPAVAEAPEVIVVTGRLPGPPMWRVTNGDNKLWIFPSFAPVPKRMEWDSTRVERVLAEAGVYLTEPGWGISLRSGGLRAWREEDDLVERLSHLPDGESLQEVLGPELYLRYAAVKARYFPRDDDIETLRPLWAMQSMRDEVQQEAGLAPASAIVEEIEKLARRNRELQRIDTSAILEQTLEFDEFAARFEALVGTVSPDAEQECFELALRRIEVDLDAIKHRANEWANGRIGEFRAVHLRTKDNPCQTMFFTSSKSETLQDLARQSEEKWLAGAELALTNHRTSFAVLGIDEVLDENGLLASLAEKGYTVHAPD